MLLGSGIFGAWCGLLNLKVFSTCYFFAVAILTCRVNIWVNLRVAGGVIRWQILSYQPFVGVNALLVEWKMTISWQNMIPGRMERFRTEIKRWKEASLATVLIFISYFWFSPARQSARSDPRLENNRGPSNVKLQKPTHGTWHTPTPLGSRYTLRLDSRDLCITSCWWPFQNDIWRITTAFAVHFLLFLPLFCLDHKGLRVRAKQCCCDARLPCCTRSMYLKKARLYTRAFVHIMFLLTFRLRLRLGLVLGHLCCVDCFAIVLFW